MTNIKCIDDFPKVEKKVNIIREFAKKMGYTTTEEYYTVSSGGWSVEPKYHNTDAFYIELNGTSDSEGNPYSWAWSMVDGKEI